MKFLDIKYNRMDQIAAAWNVKKAVIHGSVMCKLGVVALLAVLVILKPGWIILQSWGILTNVGPELDEIQQLTDFRSIGQLKRSITSAHLLFYSIVVIQMPNSSEHPYKQVFVVKPSNRQLFQKKYIWDCLKPLPWDDQGLTRCWLKPFSQHKHQQNSSC